MDRPAIGCIGLGKMGYPMALHAQRSGFAVSVYDVHPAAAAGLACYLASSTEDVGTRSQISLVMVAPASRSREVIFDQGLARGMGKGIIIDGGNADHQHSRATAGQLKDMGIDFLDIGFSGGPGKATRGELSAMAGGDHAAYQQALPLLQSFCKDIAYIGPSGSGHYAKELHNAFEYMILDGLGEVVSLARKAGLDPERVVRACNAGLSQTRLGELYLEVPPQDLAAAGSRVDGGEAAAMMLRDGEEQALGLPHARLSLFLREASRELHATGAVGDAGFYRLFRGLREDLQKYAEEQRAEGAVGALAAVAALRRHFGGHAVYPRTRPVTEGSPGNDWGE